MQVQHCVGVGLNQPQHKITVSEKCANVFFFPFPCSFVLRKNSWRKFSTDSSMLSFTCGTSHFHSVYNYSAVLQLLHIVLFIVEEWGLSPLVFSFFFFFPHLHGERCKLFGCGFHFWVLQVHVKRLGGAYGSKLNRAIPIAMACALAADKLQKPVKLILDIGTNMQVSEFFFPQLNPYI